MAGSPRTIRFNFEANANTQDLDKFSKSLNSLQQSLPPLSVNLEQARSEILQLGQTNLVTEKLIQGQITALRDLQTHVAGTSPLYRQLGNDLKGLKGDLAEITEGSKKAASATQELARALNSAVSGSGKGLDANVANLKNKLNDLKFNSQEYARVLQRITELETVASRRQGRTQAIATAAAYNDGTLTRGYGSAERLPELPQTTAGYQQRLSELSHELSNVNVGGQRYVEISREIASLNTQQARSLRTLTDELNAEGIALEGAARRAKKLADITAASPAAPGRAGVRDPETGAMIALGSGSAGDRLAYRKMLAEIEAQKVEMRAAPLALPYGDSSLPAVRGGARRVGLARDIVSVNHDEEALRLLKDFNDKEAAEYKKQVSILEQQIVKLKDLRVAAARTEINARRNAANNVPSGFASFSQDPLAITNSLDQKEAINKSIERNRRKNAVPAAPIVIEPVMREASQLQQSINDIGLSKITNLSQIMGGSYKEVAQSIRAATQASDGSINSLNSQRASWEQLKNAVALTPAELREVNKELTAIDRKLEKTQLGGGGRLKRFAQTAGTVAASGVFGGPEGLIGASAGAFFGPAGAMAGGAIGAQVGIMRQSISDAASYAAELSKLNIALRGVAGSAAEYAKAQQVIASASKDFNVPTLEATQSMTKLAAAVKGAGGNVTDTELVYRGVSSAIKATGGSAEDVQSALLAMSQVFSKGKVSAEELQGQLGERLPGAVTQFAKATGRTLPQLSKDLQDGTVGLADLMKFVAALDKQYEPMAKKLASSTEEAGARMTVALDKLKANFGGFFKPVGAGIQDLITKFADLANSIFRTTELSNKLKELNKGPTAADERALEQEAQRMGALRALSRDRRDTPYQELTLPEKAKVNVEAYGAMAGPLSPFKDGGLYGELKRDFMTQKLYDLGALAKPGIDKPFTDFDKPKAKAEKEAAAAAKKAAAEAEKPAVEQQHLNEAVVRARIALDDNAFKNAMDLIRRRYDYENELQNKLQDNWVKSLTGASREAASLVVSFMRDSEALNNRVVQAQQNSETKTQEFKSASALDAVTSQGIAGASMSGRYPQSGTIARTGSTGDSTDPHLDIRWADGRPITKADADRYFLLNGKPPSSYGVTSGYGPRKLYGRSFHAGIDFGAPSGTPVSLIGGASFGRDLGNTGAGGYGGEISTPQGAMRILHLLAGSVSKATGGSSVSVLPGRGVNAQQRRDLKADASVGVAAADLAQSNRLLQGEVEQATKLEKLLGKGFVLDFTNEIRSESAALEKQNRISAIRNRLQLEGMKPELIDAELKKAEAYDVLKDKTQLLVNIQNKYKLNAKDTKVFEDAIQGLNDTYLELASNTDKAANSQLAFNEAMRVRQDSRISDGIREGTTQYIQSIGTMRDATAQLTSTSIKGLENAIVELSTTGAFNFNQFASSVINDVSRIITQQLIVRPILQGINSLFGGGNLGGSGYYSPKTGLGIAGPNYGLADGGVFASNGIQPFAMGGIVNSPTLFKFANGGRFNTGVMGEAGPEAIMPLKRGPNGKLGIAGGSGTSVVVNVDAKGTSVQGNGGRGDQLGKVLSAAVQAELIKQRRPGGLLA